MPLMQFILLRHVLHKDKTLLEIVFGGIVCCIYILFLDIIQEHFQRCCVLYCVNAVVRHAVR